MLQEVPAEDCDMVHPTDENKPFTQLSKHSSQQDGIAKNYRFIHNINLHKYKQWQLVKTDF